MKVNTVEQFKILEYLKQHLIIAELKIEIINRKNLKVTDYIGNWEFFYLCSDNTIKYSKELPKF